jgi:hypothetical protein
MAGYPPQGKLNGFHRLAQDGVSTEYVIQIDGQEFVALTVFLE